MSSIIAPFGLSPHGGGPCTVLHRCCLSIPPLRPCPQRRGTFHAWNGPSSQSPGKPIQLCFETSAPLRYLVCPPPGNTIQNKIYLPSLPPFVQDFKKLPAGTTRFRADQEWLDYQKAKASKSSTEHARSPLWLVGYTVIGFVE